MIYSNILHWKGNRHTCRPYTFYTRLYFQELIIFILYISKLSAELNDANVLLLEWASKNNLFPRGNRTHNRCVQSHVATASQRPLLVNIWNNLNYFYINVKLQFRGCQNQFTRSFLLDTFFNINITWTPSGIT